MLRELYQELILDHGRRPRNFQVLPNANRVKEGFNPLCGDRLTLYLKIEEEVISAISFQGCGCAISMASSSLMIEYLKGKPITFVKDTFASFHNMVTAYAHDADFSNLGKLEALKGVVEFPVRVKCATLAWHTLIAAIDNDPEPVSTE
jgi:nitrogen fixation protein NifU and related proteins